MTAKEKGVNALISFVITAPALGTALWFLGGPVLVTAVSDAMAEDIQGQIKAQVAPLGSAFKALIRRDVENMQRQIADMEFKRDNPPDGDWTSDDNKRLINLRLDLVAQREALKALQ